MTPKGKPIWNNFCVFLVIALAGICLTPLLETNTKTVPRILQLIIIILWYFDVIFIKYKLRVPKPALFIMVWMLWEAAYKAIGISSAAWSNIFQKEVFFSLIIMMLYMQSGTTQTQKKVIAWSIVIFATLNILDNIILCTKYPTANELVVGGADELSVAFSKLNIGTTMFGFVTLLFSGIMLIAALNDTKFKYRFFFGLLSICSDYFIIVLSNRGITVLVWILMTGLILFTKIFIKNSKNKTILVLSIILLFFAANILSVPILKWLIKNVSSYRLQLRFGTLLSFMTSGNNNYIDQSSFMQRLYFLKLSIDTFFESFINFVFGVGYPRFEDHVIYGVGSHSEFIDSLAKYGIIGGFFIFNILKNAFKFIFENIKSYRYSTEIIIIVFTFFVYGLLNNVFTPEVGVIMFFLLPLLPILIERKEN